MKTRLIAAAIILMCGILGWADDCNDCRKLRGTWGASLTSSIDMSGHDMSNIGIEAYGGVKLPAIPILGVGTGMYVPVSNSQRALPVYLILRSNFRNRPTLLFGELRCGIAVNYLETEGHQSGEYLSAGIGIRLASTSKFSSHIVLSFTHIGRKDYCQGDDLVKLPDLQMATVRLGIAF